jgi:hypothetical protein
MTLWQAENQHEGSQELQKVDDRRQQHQPNKELGWQQQRRLICDRGNPSLPTEEATHPGHVGDVVSKTEAKQLAGKPLSCKAKASAKATGEEEQEVNREKQGAAAGVEGAVAVLEPVAVAQRPGAASLLILKPATKQIE